MSEPFSVSAKVKLRVFLGSREGQESFLTIVLFKEVQQASESVVKSCNILGFPKLLRFVLGCRNLWRIIFSVKLEFSIGESKRPQDQKMEDKYLI